jgi:predicted ATPase
LDIEGERAIAVLPLPTSSYKGEPLDGSEPEQPPAPEHLMKFASVQLFVARAQAVRPDFQVTKRNAPAVAALCERLEGIPLAIELAAAWAQTLTPGQMLSQLARRFDWLASRRKDLPERHRTLRATMEWSYRLLAPELQQFLARLSVFRGGFSLEAARAIAGWGVRMTEEPAPSKNSSASLGTGQALEPCTRFLLDFLHQLCERSLATAEEAGSEMRYRLLETLREYAAEKLPPEERVALQRRRAEYYLALAEKARPHLWGGLWQGLWLNRLEAEHDNLRLGLQWWVDNGEAEQGLRMGTALMRFWDLRGHLNEAWERLKELLSMPGASARTTARASALTAAGFLAWELGDYTTARAFHEESLAIWREIGDERCVAGSLNHLGLVAQEQGDYTTACTLYERALTINRRLGNRGSAAVDLNNQGSVALALGDYAEAWALYEQALTINRQLDNCAGIAYNLNGLATVARRQKDDATARALYEECLALCREIGNKWGVAQAFYGLGMAACRQGDTAAARSLFNESLAIYRKLGKKPDIAAALEGMAEAAQTERNSERAARLWGAAASLRETIGAPPPPCDRPDYERNVAAARAALGEKAFAAAWAQGRVLTWQQAIAYALGETT